MPRSLSNPSDGDFTPASNISTFHDPLLDEFRYRYAESFHCLPIETVGIYSWNFQAKPRESIGLLAYITGLSSSTEKEIIRNSSETSGLNMNTSENGIDKSSAPDIPTGNILQGNIFSPSEFWLPLLQYQDRMLTALLQFILLAAVDLSE